MKVYGIYDVKADSVQPQLFTLENDDVAKRYFSALLDGNAERVGLGMVLKYADDFYLVKVGDFDQEHDGTLMPENSRLCCMADLLPAHEG